MSPSNKHIACGYACATNREIGAVYVHHTQSSWGCISIPNRKELGLCIAEIAYKTNGFLCHPYRNIAKPIVFDATIIKHYKTNGF